MPPFIAFSTHESSKLWNYELNGEVTPNDVGRGCKEKYFFTCPNEKCGHNFEAQVCLMVSGHGCPYCCNFSKKICYDKDCDFCHQRSFASCDLADKWSSSNELSAREVIKTSIKYYWFYCDVCNHEFLSIVRNVAQGKFCGFCYGIRLCPDEHCDFCKANSFASSRRAIYWAKENLPVRPRDVFKGKQEKFWFDCPCGHKVLLSLEGIYKGYWCHYCCNKSVRLCDSLDCQMCHEKSFASHPKVGCWSPENKFSPRDVMRGATKRVKFICDKNPKHLFEMPLFSVYLGNWCHLCTRKMESKLWEILSETYVVKKQPKFDWCKGPKGNYRPFDFLISGTKVLIELDGGQHFVQVKNWQTPEYTQANDKFKMTKAFENGYSVIRITWDVVRKDKSFWLDLLLKMIECAKNEEGSSQGYICDKREYDVY